MSGTFWSIEEIEPILRERNELKAEIEALKKQAKQDAYLIEAQKREIIVLQAARDYNG